MDLTEKQKKEVQKIMDSMDCPCDFECYKSGFNHLCKAEYHGLNDFANCLETTPRLCKFRIPFGFGGFCSCTLRVYIAKLQRK